MKRLLAVLIALLLLAGGVRADITSNLVAHWKLDETSGTSAADSSGNGHTGTYTNSPTLNQTGAFGSSKAVTFASASSQYTAIGTPGGLLKNTSQATLACWCKIATTGTNKYLVCVSTGTSATGRRAALYHTLSNNFRCYAAAGDAEPTQYKSTNNPYTGTDWYHVVATIDYANDTVIMYVNGTAVAQAGTIAFAATATSNTDALAASIGAIGNGSSLPWDGTIDDVRIYSRALSAADVAELYAYTGTRFPYWYFNSSGCDPFKVFRTRQPLAIVTTR